MSTEVEAKFYVCDLRAIAARLETLGAEVVHPRVHEQNWRYDTPERSLEADWQILRLRVSHKTVLTYKGRAEEVDGTSQRSEFETEVGNLVQTRMLLDALGYEVSGYYEKYRTEYHLGNLSITLDEMPIGNFIEIEGDNVSAIQKAASDLSLKWETNITENYIVLFNRMKQVLGLEIKEMTFDGLTKVDANPETWGISPADS
jgi:adenylate cyclase class 2